MFIIFGTKPRKVKVDGGLKREKYCSNCGSAQTFEEVRWINHFALFFVPLFPIQSIKAVESVLACPKCDTSYEI
ncbi:MAG: hypothetical protein AMK69_18800 [Nitrospira bacterium SG8_3]|nr:MAG: hypothetical protein AMK69_18800 [Nitrospira bacterium SG8_3]